MTDKEREKYISLAAKIYVAVFVIMVSSVLFLTKEQGILLFLMFISASFIYAIFYKVILKGLKDEARLIVAFSRYGNGGIEGISYSASKAIILFSTIFSAVYLYEYCN